MPPRWSIASRSCCSPTRSRRRKMSEPRMAVKDEAVVPLRPEIVRDQTAQFAVVQKPLSALERIYNQVWLRKILILVVLALIWEAYGRYLNNDLLFPTFSATMRAFIESILQGGLPAPAWRARKRLG